METKKLTTIHLNNLKIDDLYSLNKSTIGYAEPVKENIGQMPNATLAQLKYDNQAMGVQMNKALKNVLTPQVTKMNADREDRFAEVKRNLTTALKGRNEKKKAAADNLKIFFNPYWDADKKAINTQTGIYFEMLDKFNASETLKAHAVTIGIAQMMAELEVSNNEFNEVYETRLTQEAAAEGPSATSLRAAATNSYNQFCIALEQAVNFMPNEAINALFNQLDELRKTYARLVHTEEEPEPEQTTAPVE